MKRYFLIILLLLAGCFISQAQLRVAVQCAVKDGDLTAYRMNDTQPIVIDGDTIPFAIVRVGLAEPNVVFDSKWVLKQENKDNEYWVYFMEGVKSVSIKTKRFTPLHYKFPEPLRAKDVYTMTILKPDSEKYMGTLYIHSNVHDADVYVDGTKISDGTPAIYTGESGMHTVELRADGFDPQTREVDVLMSRTRDITINLFSTGSLSVGGVSYGMVPIGASSYIMGSTLNYFSTPPHNVSLRPFSAGSTLVSVDLWKAVMGEADPKIEGSNGEVVNVSYDEVMDFIAALNSKTGQEFRLPTEAEWEYLARNASGLGISDIQSRMEWCSDWFGRYNISDTTNPQGAESGHLRSVRGGAEYTDSDPVYKDVSFRWRKMPDKSSPYISFRLVQDQ
ncbi:MAG: SUMF1/EgtB/PvdO family nonheme iron enzyme [Bacteroides sp.]|nr:SUMF1/EgtB/PvdO family nonheme iron enzyme [Bacteroides sp.]MCM1457996.1 SUMF1/EgtB/PvdO family nonheme iron enzyme [Lachnoclostridium sp.]